CTASTRRNVGRRREGRARCVDRREAVVGELAPLVGCDARRGRRIVSDQAAVHGVVMSGTGGIWQIRMDEGAVVDASLRGRLKKSNSGKRADGSLRRDTVLAAAETLKLAVGDDVLIEPGAGTDTWAI